jgi:hypothetical protein
MSARRRSGLDRAGVTPEMYSRGSECEGRGIGHDVGHE